MDNHNSSYKWNYQGYTRNQIGTNTSSRNAMVRTSEIDMADSVAPSDIDAVLTNASWAIRSTYHTVLKASPGAAIFGRDMLFDIPFIAD